MIIKLFKLSKKISVGIFSIFLFGIIFFDTTPVFAVVSPYSPGETLDPSCSPGSTNCYVNFTSNISIGDVVNNGNLKSLLFIDGSGNLGQNNHLTYDGGFSMGNASVTSNTNSLAFGYDNLNVGITRAIASGKGALAFGYGDYSGNINASGNGSQAFGFVFQGTITSSGEGSSSSGYTLGYGAITASGFGSNSFGFVDNNGSIISSGDGSFAFGSSKYSSIISSGDGSFAGGYTSGSNEDITSSGVGSFAFGESSVYGPILASGTGSFAFGSGVSGSGDYSFSFGTGFSNSDNESFKIGWDGSIQFIASNTGGITLPSLGGSGDRMVTVNNAGLLTATNIPESIPNQTGNSGKYLTTNGTNISWGSLSGWSTLGNSGTTAGTNFIGTTDTTALVFKTNNIERMRIGTDGKIGINQSSPLGYLHVTTDSFAAQPVFERTSSTITAISAGAGQYLFNSLGTSIASYTGSGVGNVPGGNGLSVGINFAYRSNTDAVKNVAAITAGLVNYATGKGQLNFTVNNSGVGNPSMIISSNGNILVGPMTDAGYALQVGTSSVSGIVARFENSSGTCDINPTTSSLSCSSDQNLKKDITNIEGNILSQIIQLQPVTYHWKTEQQADMSHIGFIAQQVESIFPNLVATDTNSGLKSLNYVGLTPYTIAAIKELDLKVKEIELIDDQSTFKSRMVSWLGDVTNGIENIFANKITTDKICIRDLRGETCLSRSDIDNILSNTNSGNLGDSSNFVNDNTSTGNDNSLQGQNIDNDLPNQSAQSTDSVLQTL